MKVEAQRLQASQRSRYMSGDLSHQEYYIWLSEFVGITTAMIPANLRTLMASTDEHLNDIPLHKWDSKHHACQSKAFSKGLAWSMGDSVCCLKALARRVIDAERARALPTNNA